MPHPIITNNHIKQTAYTQTLKRVEESQPLLTRLFSKLIHSTPVEKPGELIAKTIARPSAIIGGGLLALLGSSFLLWVAHSNGHAYNYLAGPALYLVGATSGIATEWAINIIKSVKS